MRWDDLFADLESQLEQELGAEELDVAAEEERLRLGRLTLRDRIVAFSGQQIVVELVEGTRVELRVEAIGRDWVSGAATGARAASCLVPLDAIAGLLAGATPVAGALEPTPERPDALSRRLGLSFVLRDLCRRRCPVDVTTASRALHGTIDRVGRDHVDLAEHDPGEPRRPGAVRAVRILPFAGIRMLRF
ncbi:hypothetical protein GCM10009840_14790 [Pseudolysinimonas kribbensis]|uniref:Ribosome maturation factor RimP n=1 Tax=Pseudolysinimonas kribbensis TaxID=433641 RepID=A0ABQ6K5R1_9MICO|nr:hypothetical protein [Pseudolysinimonas kribbensis]GMA94187.1 hypothetical protein GCM10025881_10110 [Pseudolysinimonas kribbensis]